MSDQINLQDLFPERKNIPEAGPLLVWAAAPAQDKHGREPVIRVVADQPHDHTQLPGSSGVDYINHRNRGLQLAVYGVPSAAGYEVGILSIF